MKSLLLGVIRLYQFLLSPWVGNQCRFWPTCSEYARLAIEHHGSARGSFLAARRICRCHPWHPGGFDPVPGVPLPDDALEAMRGSSQDANDERHDDAR